MKKNFNILKTFKNKLITKAQNQNIKFLIIKFG